MQLHLGPFTLGKHRVMDPDPHVAQDESDRNEQQSDVGISGTSVNACLTHLTIACLDAEAFAVKLPDLCRRPLHSPRGEEQLLFDLLLVFPISMPSISQAHRNGDLLVPILHGVRIPARPLLLDPSQSGGVSPFRWASSAKHDRHEKWQTFLFQELHHGHVEERAIQQDTLDFQAHSANSRDQSVQHQ